MGLTRLFLAQRGLCFHCRKPMIYAPSDRKKGLSGRRYNRDHLVPVSKGGGNHGRNIVLTHASCNRDRGNADPTQEMFDRAEKIWALAVRISQYEVVKFTSDRTVVGTLCSAYKWPGAKPGPASHPELYQ